MLCSHSWLHSIWNLSVAQDSLEVKTAPPWPSECCHLDFNMPLIENSAEIFGDFRVKFVTTSSQVIIFPHNFSLVDSLITY